MALTVSNGISIPVTPGSPTVFGAGTPPPLHAQRATQWCWAACAQMVAAGNSNPQTLEQCKLASDYHGVAGCCQNMNSGCNRPASVNKIDKVFADHNISFTYASSNISESDVLVQLANGHLIEVGWHRPGHVALIVNSYQSPAGNNIFVVHDPLPVNAGTVHRANYNALQTLASYSDWKSTWHSIF